MEDIHDLFRQVKQHPDFVFGTIFVKDDFADGAVPDDFPASRATDALIERGNYVIEQLGGEIANDDDDEESSTCANCGRRIFVLDPFIDDCEPSWLHTATSLAECDANAPFGPGAVPVPMGDD